MGSLVLQFTESDFESIRKSSNLPLDIKIFRKTELRQLSAFSLLKLLRKEKYDQVLVFCDDLAADRRLILFKLFLVLIRAKQRKLVDAIGNVQEVTLSKFCRMDLPEIFWRMIVSYLTVALTYVVFTCVTFRKGKV